MPKPNLLIVGCQKCGTTWLHRSLQKSRHVFGTQIKELCFFNKPNYETKWAEYLRHFTLSEGATYYMESTPHYFQLPGEHHDVANSIKRSLPDVKLIVLFRNPIDRYESAYIHHMLQGRLPYTQIISEVSGNHHLIELGRYASILAHWQAIFDKIGVYFYDDIVLDPRRMFGKVMEFLDLDNDVPPDALDFRANAKDLRLRRLELDWPTMPEISSGARETLANIYREEITELQELTGRDLSHWK